MSSRRYRATMKGWFVTGTDTGVGKTLVTAALCLAGRERGHDWLPAKPVQTGAPHASSPDLDFCLNVCGLTPEPILRNQLSPMRFTLAASPHFAAQQEGRSITVADLTQAMNAIHAEAVVVEGAGGIRVPLNDREDLRDLMNALGLPIILVARSGLGTLNATRLSIDSLYAIGLTLDAVALTPFNPADPLESNNLKTIGGWIPGIPVIPLPSVNLSDPEHARMALREPGERLYEAVS